MAQAATTYLGEQRRRSSRIEHIAPIVICGIDLLGQPFEERTATQVLSFHGCRYASKHHLPKNTWVTLEIPAGHGRQETVRVRARVAWIQKPKTLRELFQVGAEIENGGNIWGVTFPPEDWSTMASASDSLSSNSSNMLSPSDSPSANPQRHDASADTSLEQPVLEAAHRSESQADAQGFPASAGDNPLFRRLQGEFDVHAQKILGEVRALAEQTARDEIDRLEGRQNASAEVFYQRWREEFERENAGAKQQLSDALSRQLSAELARSRREIEGQLKNEWQERLSRQLADLRQQLEVAGLYHEAAEGGSAEGRTEAAAGLRERLDSDLASTRNQWIELLESSLDSAAERLARRLTDGSQQTLQASEQKLGATMAALHQEFGESVESARAALGELRSALENDLSRARLSLSEIEQAAGNLSDFSRQLESARADSLAAMRRQFKENMDLQVETTDGRIAEMLEHLTGRARTQLEHLTQETIARSTAETETKIAPVLERAREASRQLEAREQQTEETLRMQRERLRQVADQVQREAGVEMSRTLARLRSEFEESRKQALQQWSSELTASGARASEEASAALAQAVASRLVEAGLRLQAQIPGVLEQLRVDAERMLQESSAKLSGKLEELGTLQLDKAREGLDLAAQQSLHSSRAAFQSAAEVAAANFGPVLHAAAVTGLDNFSKESRAYAEEGRARLLASAEEVLHNFQGHARECDAQFQEQLAGRIEQTQAQVQRELEARLNGALGTLGAQGEEKLKEWGTKLEALGSGVSAQFDERLQSAAAALAESTLRQLETLAAHRMEALARGAEEAARHMCVGVLDSMAQAVKERFLGGSAAPGDSVPGPGESGGRTKHATA